MNTGKINLVPTRRRGNPVGTRRCPLLIWFPRAGVGIQSGRASVPFNLVPTRRRGNPVGINLVNLVPTRRRGNPVGMRQRPFNLVPTRRRGNPVGKVSKYAFQHWHRIETILATLLLRDWIPTPARGNQKILATLLLRDWVPTPARGNQTSDAFATRLGSHAGAWEPENFACQSAKISGMVCGDNIIC